jgi:hypothetical protein
MILPAHTTRKHYDEFLFSVYPWMTGGIEDNVKKAARFFTEHAIAPSGTTTAVDLGAGCGYGSLALAGLGFHVTAVDFSGPMLRILRQHAGNLPVKTVQADILDLHTWSGRSPSLITCMGDTLTHLRDKESVRLLIRHCTQELARGGKTILSFRDYSREPEGAVTVIPVRRDNDHIFLCRLAYGALRVEVTDTLYTRASGVWQRHAGVYSKLRIRPDSFQRLLDEEGMRIITDEMRDGFVTIVAEKQ